MAGALKKNCVAVCTMVPGWLRFSTYRNCVALETDWFRFPCWEGQCSECSHGGGCRSISPNAIVNAALWSVENSNHHARVLKVPLKATKMTEFEVGWRPDSGKDGCL